MKKILLLAAALAMMITMISCGTATVKVSNSSSYSIQDIWIGLVYFPDIVGPGGSTAAVSAIAGTYSPTFYRWDGASWNYYTTDSFTVTSGLFGANENTWEYSNSTSVY